MTVKLVTKHCHNNYLLIEKHVIKEHEHKDFKLYESWAIPYPTNISHLHLDRYNIYIYLDKTSHNYICVNLGVDRDMVIGYEDTVEKLLKARVV